MQFLASNLEEFEPAVRTEIQQLATEVLEDDGELGHEL